MPNPPQQRDRRPVPTAQPTLKEEEPVTLAQTTADTRSGRADRAEVFLEYTKSICPVCKIVTDAEVNIRDERVFLRKRCPTHGVFEALVYSDAKMYMDSLRFNKPGTIPLATQTETLEACRP